MFIRSRSVKGREYFAVVTSYRDGSGTPRHRTVASLGTEPTVAGALAGLQAKHRRLTARRARYPSDPRRVSEPDRAEVARWDERISRVTRRLADLRKADWLMMPRPESEADITPAFKSKFHAWMDAVALHHKPGEEDRRRIIAEWLVANRDELALRGSGSANR